MTDKTDVNAVYRRSEDIAWRNIADETVLVPVARTAADAGEVIVLNETAGRIWNLLDGTRTVSQVADRLVAEYQISPDAACAELASLLKRLVEQGLAEQQIEIGDDL